MMSKTDLKALIRSQKIAARKSIASKNIKVSQINSHEQYSLFRTIADERKFLAYDFSDINDVYDLMDTIHTLRHKSISKISSFMRCRHCKKILAEMAITLPGAPGQDEASEYDEEDRIKPRLGNLLSILESEVQKEVANMERRRIPSQNDLTRWALKEATYRWYRDKFQNMPSDTVIVDNMYDDRVKTEFAPDFSEIYNMWVEKLDELSRLDDRYTLNLDEIDKAREDLDGGMRGSAFEKQLDRYREDFMKQLYAQM